MRTPLLELTLALLLAAPLPGLAGAARWHEFDYYKGNVLGSVHGEGEERLALLLRASVNGTSCWLQLDTGAPAAVHWHTLRPDGTAPAPVTVTVRIGDVEKTLAADAANLAPLRQPSCGVIGTAGNAFFEHGTLALDFRDGRLAFAPGSALRDVAAAQPMLYLRSGGPGGHPLLPATLPDGRSGHLLFDTGAARFGLAAIDAQGWRQLAGDRPLLRTFGAGNVTDRSPLACRDAAYPESIVVGAYTIAPGMVSFCEGRPFQLAQPLLGILGVKSVGARQVTLDYVAQRWLLGEPGRSLDTR
ncbi:hypothetical protein GJV26_08105 [Massilia dura]|uniref:Aspartyl protease n=1 Tax=Pseudoduganella dura TaxID=321982 RepID=A0A6I3XFP4_9BURK|nr:hypothetical protein [Pseudoduganella dura]MUI12431.1 hypothetical protein [Pseudoduganella dura]GGX85274.1 hypothetical protein GCM10007386_15100 [Pseudoduganella dura]